MRETKPHQQELDLGPEAPAPTLEVPYNDFHATLKRLEAQGYHVRAFDVLKRTGCYRLHLLRKARTLLGVAVGLLLVACWWRWMLPPRERPWIIEHPFEKIGRLCHVGEATSAGRSRYAAGRCGASEINVERTRGAVWGGEGTIA